MKHLLSVVLFCLSVLFLCLCAVHAARGQAAPRTIDFTTKLIGFDGRPLAVPSADPKAPPVAITLGEAAINALEAATEEDRTMPGIQKFKLDALTRKIYGNRRAELSVEEIALIKERIGKAYGPVVVGAAWRLLDPSGASGDK